MIGAVAVGALLFVFQHALFVGFTIFGVHPEFLLLYAVCCGLANGSNYGLVAGFAAGLLSDAFLTSPLGLSAFAFALVGYLAGVISDDTTSSPLPTATSAAAMSALAILIISVLGRLTGSLHLAVGHAFAVIVVASLVNAIIALPVVRALRKFHQEKVDLSW